MKKITIGIISLFSLSAAIATWIFGVYLPCQRSENIGAKINNLSCQCSAMSLWKFGQGCLTQPVDLSEKINPALNYDTNANLDAYQWPINIIPYHERATPSYTPPDIKYVECELDNKCKLKKTVLCQACNKIKWECIEK